MSERKIVDYKILIPEEGLFDLFVLNINDEIANGWQPIGGIAASTVREDDKVTLFQAMVKYEEKIIQQPYPYDQFLPIRETEKNNDVSKDQEVDKISDTEMIDFLEEKLKIDNIHFIKRPQSIEFKFEDTNSYSDTIRLSIESAIKNDKRR